MATSGIFFSFALLFSLYPTGGALSTFALSAPVFASQNTSYVKKTTDREFAVLFFLLILYSKGAIDKGRKKTIVRI